MCRLKINYTNSITINEKYYFSYFFAVIIQKKKIETKSAILNFTFYSGLPVRHFQLSVLHFKFKCNYMSNWFQKCIETYYFSLNISILLIFCVFLLFYLIKMAPISRKSLQFLTLKRSSTLRNLKIKEDLFLHNLHENHMRTTRRQSMRILKNSNRTQVKILFSFLFQ